MVTLLQVEMARNFIYVWKTRHLVAAREIARNFRYVWKTRPVKGGHWSDPQTPYLLIVMMMTMVMMMAMMMMTMTMMTMMIFRRRGGQAPRGGCSHINVTHWQSTRLTYDKTENFAAIIIITIIAHILK